MRRVRGLTLALLWQFLRNGCSGRDLDGLKGKSECLGSPQQIAHHSLAIAHLIRRGAGIHVVHSVPHGVVEQDRDLASRSGDGFGLADARRKPPVEGAQRGSCSSNGYGSKA